jgi:hypothetical protein
MKMTGTRWCVGPTGRRWLAAGAVALAACSAAGALPSAALAGSPQTPNWTRQLPAAHPPGHDGGAAAYDAATATVVLFGGYSARARMLGGTWTWDGTTWAKQSPAASPSARDSMAMAYDAATATVVLFGGIHGERTLADTWTWDGTTWTQQHPATSPSARTLLAMAYDAATATMVVFGGCCRGPHGVFGDTWTWDGITWTQQHPATSPPARLDAAMAYDAAAGNVVLFSGDSQDATLHDTWTWG